MTLTPEYIWERMKLDPLQNKPTSDATRSYSILNNDGTRFVAWRRYDGTTYITTEPKECEDPVVKAIEGNAVSALKEMVKTRGNTMLANKLGWLPLHEAAGQGRRECLEILLKAHPEVIDRRTVREETALFLAVLGHHAACVHTLLQWGASPDIANVDKETPLFKACEEGKADIVAMLLESGAAVNQHCIQGWTALHEAVCRNNVEICEMLVKAGAKIDAANIYGITPLFTAAQSGNAEALSFLINQGADVNSQAFDGATPLYEACKNGHRNIVVFLLFHNVDIHKPTKAGLIPLHIAAQRGFKEIMSMLIPVTSGSSVCSSGISPLHLAAEHCHNDALQLLIHAGFQVDARLSAERSAMYPDRRTTPLYFSVFNNHLQGALMLLEAGANPNLDVFNPLLVAVRQGNAEMTRLLVEHGANVNAYVPTLPTSFSATIMFSVRYMSLFKYLLDKGCDAMACFKCEHGIKPHSPRIALRVDDLGQHNEESTVQFCDLLSSPSMSEWAGPIIAVLLNYVGNVKLCSRLIQQLDSCEDWAHTKAKSMTPQSLKQHCRLKIRKQFGTRRLGQINILPLPDRLLSYLNYEHLETD